MIPMMCPSQDTCPALAHAVEGWASVDSDSAKPVPRGAANRAHHRAGLPGPKETTWTILGNCSESMRKHLMGGPSFFIPNKLEQSLPSTAITARTTP